MELEEKYQELLVSIHESEGERLLRTDISKKEILEGETDRSFYKKVEAIASKGRNAKAAGGWVQQIVCLPSAHAFLLFEHCRSRLHCMEVVQSHSTRPVNPLASEAKVLLKEYVSIFSRKNDIVKGI